MAGKVLQVEHYVTIDQLAAKISNFWVEWEAQKQIKIAEWVELKKYIYATSTATTTNNTLPWNNKTTIPKLTQIRDNLHANYMASMFPKRRWLTWQADVADDQKKEKASKIRDYMTHVISQPQFEQEISKLVLDYIDTGNVFVMPDWADRRVEQPDKTQTGYVGPMPRRVSPWDINFNPFAPSFVDSPKIVRSVISLGETKKLLQQLSKTDKDREEAQYLWDYMINLRGTAKGWAKAPATPDYFNIEGFQNFREYLVGDYVELLTFYGDLYDTETDSLYENHIITVVDRHKIAYNQPNESWFGTVPIYHCGWRQRQDNLWAMGPLDNLVGMQYRIDHIENMKADLFDLTVFPPLKIKGYVEDFEWGPFERIFVGDDGDVELMNPDSKIMQSNMEIAQLEQKMEEMAGAPREAMGFRTPGEKTMYEVQRLENASARIFQAKINQFERLIMEPLLNSMLELSRRKMEDTVVRYVDDETGVALFRELTPSDITGQGRIIPIAARNFAEKAERFQNLNNFYTQGVGTDPEVRVHFSTIKLAEMMEELMDVKDYKIVEPFIRLSEQADAQRQAQVQQEQVLMEAQTSAGIEEDDFDVA